MTATHKMTWKQFGRMIRYGEGLSGRCRVISALTGSLLGVAVAFTLAVRGLFALKANGFTPVFWIGSASMMYATLCVLAGIACTIPKMRAEWNRN